MKQCLSPNLNKLCALAVPERGGILTGDWATLSGSVSVRGRVGLECERPEVVEDDGVSE